MSRVGVAVRAGRGGAHTAAHVQLATLPGRGALLGARWMAPNEASPAHTAPPGPSAAPRHSPAVQRAGDPATGGPPPAHRCRRLPCCQLQQQPGPRPTGPAAGPGAPGQPAHSGLGRGCARVRVTNTVYVRVCMRTRCMHAPPVSQGPWPRPGYQMPPIAGSTGLHGSSTRVAAVLQQPTAGWRARARAGPQARDAMGWRLALE